VRIGDNIHWQAEGETVADTLEPVPPTGRRDAPPLMHVLNLYQGDEEGLGHVQERTVESMRRAAAYAATQVGGFGLDFVSVHSDEDQWVVPEGFRAAPTLTRDARSIVDLPISRPLPLLFDILGSADRAVPDAEFVIFTNSDICLMPGFYVAVLGLLGRGFDTVIINRRTIMGWTPEDGDVHLAMAELGDSHPGHDCFVFRRSLIRRFAGNLACVGAGYVMRGLLYNLVAHSERMLFLNEAHLTYHYGNDQPWAEPAMKPLVDHNRRQLAGTHEALARSETGRIRLAELFEAMPRFRPPGYVAQHPDA
jgi:hypothetical protein